MRRHVAQLHAKSQVGLVDPVAANRFAIFHVPERRGHFDAGHRAARTITCWITSKISCARGKRHLQVQLREFRLPVGAQILVAETARDLEIAVHSRRSSGSV